MMVDGKLMDVEADSPSLVALMRARPILAPGDSIRRAVELLRSSGADALAVLDARGALFGVVALTDLRPMLGSDDVEAALFQPVAHIARRPGSVGRPEMSAATVRRTLQASGETSLFILDDADRYLGAIALADVLAPTEVPPRPHSVGGMATPWGVYLTDGTLQAGANNLALVGGGVLMGFMLALSYAGVAIGAWAGQRAFGWSLFTIWKADAPPQTAGGYAVWLGLQGASLLLFLVMMRLLPLAGYHAAEHQSVHALERGEPLRPEVVRRMPRVHPRCGTNLMAAGLVFGTVLKTLPELRIGFGATDSAVIGAILALFTWRSIGAFLQYHFTTRTATDRQLANGIAAANALETKYLHSVLRRPTLLRRLWCMGLAQVTLGAAVAATPALYVLDLLSRRLT